jgi:hypothetical protein
MVNSKRKGKSWEYQARDQLNAMFSQTWKRIPGSGAIGTIVEIPHLTGDLIGKYEFIPFVFRGECKVGYGGKDMTIHKEWFDKIRKESEENFNNIPCVLIKFDGARDGVRYFIALDFQAWFDLLKWIERLYNENVEILGELEEIKSKNDANK